ncbi:MAG TPA: hypothetical protein VLE22_25655 [Bryobacteraceae bacterium]|nr:hypothetical protein [Bryobacteraceae bacterium]
MASIRQINANRKNARRSTGPTSDEGKARSASNALQHGLLSRDIVLPDEDAEEFTTLAASYTAQLDPQGPLEEFCVRQMVAADWKLRRLLRLETGMLAYGVEYIRDVDDDDDRWSGNSSYEETTVLLGKMISGSSRTTRLSLLTRYESSIRQSWYKALKEYERLRSLRPPRRPEQAPLSGPPRHQETAGEDIGSGSPEMGLASFRDDSQASANPSPSSFASLAASRRTGLHAPPAPLMLESKLCR